MYDIVEGELPGENSVYFFFVDSADIFQFSTMKIGQFPFIAKLEPPSLEKE